MKYYTYGLKFYDPCDDSIENKYGVVAADCYGEAVEKVIGVYGEENIDDVKLSEMTRDDCVEILTEDEDGCVDWGYDAMNAFISSVPSNPFDKNESEDEEDDPSYDCVWDEEDEPQDPSDLSEEDEDYFDDDNIWNDEEDDDEDFWDDEEEEEDEEDYSEISDWEDPFDDDEEEHDVCDEGCEECTNLIHDDDWVKEGKFWKKETEDDNSSKKELYYSSNPNHTPEDIRTRLAEANDKMEKIQQEINAAYEALIEGLRRSYNRSGIAEGI